MPRGWSLVVVSTPLFPWPASVSNPYYRLPSGGVLAYLSSWGTNAFRMEALWHPDYGGWREVVPVDGGVRGPSGPVLALGEDVGYVASALVSMVRAGDPQLVRAVASALSDPAALLLSLLVMEG